MLNIVVPSSVSCSEYFIQEGKRLSKIELLISVFFDGITGARREDTGPGHLPPPWPLSRAGFQLASLGAREIEHEHISNLLFPRAVTHLPLRIPVQPFPFHWTFSLALSDFSIHFYPVETHLWRWPGGWTQLIPLRRERSSVHLSVLGVQLPSSLDKSSLD